ncbi:cupredoxin domain-containing protein [Pseudalkalibacillus decolorationis]|uniref:cupredoxin domain-containing protein n=1 Tax=Pseudalkalibacillus decolorationis TaxID=163879 RepID=UPI0021483C0D|nr:cupredoxin domain-containing protein [Pseudalkalibacillus decolorationis]
MKRYFLNTLLVFGVAIAILTVFQKLEFTEMRAKAETPVEVRQNKLEVELDDFYFEPDEIKLKVNQPTTLILENEGDVQHTFTVRALNIDVVLEPGEKKEIVVKPNKTGTFELICRFHQEKMVGKVIVTQ